MANDLDKSAKDRWNKMDIAYQNYKNFIDKKEDQFLLTLVDLLYIKNFKGGSATFFEEEVSVNDKLKEYLKLLKEIDDKFNGKTLQNLDDSEVKELINLADEAFNLVIPADVGIPSVIE